MWPAASDASGCRPNRLMQIELKNIHKHYGPVRANDGVSLTIRPGSIHGILGENGAGKSTLMKILTGFARKTSGIIRIDDRSADIDTPAAAARFRIGMLHQEPLDFPALTALDNFMIGRTSGLRPHLTGHRKRLTDIAARLGFNLDPEAPLNRLTVGERQQLEILRLLALDIRVLILDEPTTGISRPQKETLFTALKTLAADGKSVLLVSHKLEDVMALCDEITVMRQGKVSGRMATPFDVDALLQMMFGALPSPPVYQPGQPGQPVLTLDQVTAPGGRAGLTKCSVRVHAGEIVGLAGLEGSGQGVFLRVAAGLVSPARGEVRLGDSILNGGGYYDFRNRGGAFVPASRMEEGLIPGLTLGEHFSLNERKAGFFMAGKTALARAGKAIAQFNIKGRPEMDASALSGGNQQRLLLSLLPEDPRILLLENPTRGLDLDSGHWVWRHLQAQAARGTAIVFSSAELDEILMVADRTIVFYNGRMVMDVPAHQADADMLGRAVAGGGLS